MKALRISTALLCTTAIGILIAFLGGLEFQLSWRDNDAQAIDFFNQDEEGDPADTDPFSQEKCAS